MKRRVLACLLSLTLLAVTALAGCEKKDDGQSKTGESGKGSSKDAYKIGAFLRFSDEAGTKMKATITKAFDDINDAGGINGHPVKLIMYDTEGDSTKAIDAFNRLISEDKALLAIGPTTSSCALAVIDIAKDYEIPLITPQATNTDITREYGNKWFFRNSVADIYHSYTLCDYIVKDMKAKKIAIMHETGTLGLGQYENFVERLEDEYNMEPVIVKEWNEGDVDFKTQLLAVKEAKPDVIVFAGHEAELAIAVSQRLDVGISEDVAVCGFSSMSSSDYYNVAGKAAAGSIFVTTFSPTDDREDIQRFVNEYKSVVPAMDHNSAQAYDTVELLKDTLKGVKLGNTEATLKEDRTAIRDALAKVKDWKGLTGITTFGPGGGLKDRDGKKTSSVYQLKDDFTWTCLKAAE